jgi:hypothetical protein
MQDKFGIRQVQLGSVVFMALSVKHLTYAVVHLSHAWYLIAGHCGSVVGVGGGDVVVGRGVVVVVGSVQTPDTHRPSSHALVTRTHGQPTHPVRGKHRVRFLGPNCSHLSMGSEQKPPDRHVQWRAPDVQLLHMPSWQLNAPNS